MRNSKIDQIFGVGAGISLLALRRYYDGAGKHLDYNSSTLPKLKDGKYWGFLCMIDYRLTFHLKKQLYLEIDSKLYTSTKTRKSKATYEINQGSGLSIN